MTVLLKCTLGYSFVEPIDCFKWHVVSKWEGMYHQEAVATIYTVYSVSLLVMS
jgi:hypothetical protein